MSCLDHCCVLTRGEFYISDYKGGCSDGLSEILCENLANTFKKVGNVSSAQVGIETTIIGKENKFNPMKDACSRVNISGVELTITFECASASNLYRALFSEKSEDVDGPGLKDFCIDSLDECDFFPFAHPGVDPESLEVVLRNNDNEIVKTLVLDEDYSVTKSGIDILREIDIEDAVTLRLMYNYNTEGYHIFKFLSKFMGYKSIYFKGTNFAGGEQGQFDCEFHKVLFTPINTFDLITKDEFFTITLNGSVELDKSKEEWFKIIKQE